MSKQSEITAYEAISDYIRRKRKNLSEYPQRRVSLPEEWFWDSQNNRNTFVDVFSQFCELYHYKITRSNDFQLQINDDFLQKLRFFYRYLTQEKSVRGLYVFGSYGSGKTMTLWALAEMLKMFHEKKGWNYLMITSGAIIEKYKEAAENKDKYSYDDLRMKKLLIIDDLGNETSSIVSVWGNKVKPVESVIEFRYRTGRWTWITSNYSLKQLADRYSGFIIDRLREMMYFVHYTWDSYRN